MAPAERMNEPSPHAVTNIEEGTALNVEPGATIAATMARVKTDAARFATPGCFSDRSQPPAGDGPQTRLAKKNAPRTLTSSWG